MLAIVICLLLTLAYVTLMIAYSEGWKRQKDFVMPSSSIVFSAKTEYQTATFISIIIPARNECRNIGGCIESVLAQKYPADLFEIIVVDDHSEDGTAEVVKKYADKNVRCISLADHLAAGKKINACLSHDFRIY